MRRCALGVLSDLRPVGSQARQNAPATFVLGDEHAGHLAYLLDQRRLGAADHNAFEAGGVHGEVAQRVSCNDDGIQVEALYPGELAQRCAFVHAARQDIEIAPGREQQLAAERVNGCTQFGGDTIFTDKE